MNGSELTRLLIALAAPLPLTSCSSDLTKADTSARRFVRLLNAGDDAAARDELKHFGPKQPTSANLHTWWSGCTRQSGRAKGLDLAEWKVTEGLGAVKTSARLRYSLKNADGSEVPLFFTVKLEHGDWRISDFACAMPNDRRKAQHLLNELMDGGQPD